MKNHKTNRFVAALSASALAATALGSMPAAPVSAAPLTGRNAQSIVSQMKVGWNLGNTLDSTNPRLKSTDDPAKFAKAWNNPEPSDELFLTVRTEGFNTVRIPTTWYQHLEWDEESQMYLVNETWMDYVKQTVDYAYDRDMFVILNVHHEDWVNVSVFTDETYSEAEKKLTDIWTQVAETFKDYDQHLIFEGMNEPRQTNNPNVNEWGNGTEDGGYTSKYINDLNAAFVKAVRGNGSAANAERLLMLPGYCASNDQKAIRAVEIPENAGNVALSVHAYTPYFFTMDTSSYANHEFPGKSGYGADYEAELTNMFKYLDQIQQEKGVPIIIGEFSASDFDNTESRVAWATDYLTKAKAVGIPCVLWDNNVVGKADGEAHGYVKRSDNTWYEQSKPVVDAMMAVYGITPGAYSEDPGEQPTDLTEYQLEITALDKETEAPLAGVEIRFPGGVEVTNEDGKVVTTFFYDENDTMRAYVSGVPEGYADPEKVEAGTGQFDLINGDNTITFYIPHAEEAGEISFDYEALEDGEEGKIIPIDDPEHLSKIIIEVDSACDDDSAPWYCGGGALCSNDFYEDGTEQIWGFKEFQWNAGDTQVEVEFDGTFKKPDPDEPNANLPAEGTFTGTELEMRHWWTASPGTDDGSDVTYTYGKVTVIYDYAAETPTEPDETTEPISETDQPTETDVPSETDSQATGDVLFGDINGDNTVDIMDVIAVNKYLLGSGALDDDQKTAADVDRSGEVDATDSLNILKYVVEILTSLPV